MCLGIPGRIVAIDDPEKRLATVDIAGVRQQVNVATILAEGEPAEACLGGFVLCHLGFAMRRVEAAEAEQTLALLVELAAAQATAREEAHREGPPGPPLMNPRAQGGG